MEEDISVEVEEVDYNYYGYQNCWINFSYHTYSNNWKCFTVHSYVYKHKVAKTISLIFAVSPLA